MVGAVGVEPTYAGLKDRCTTAMPYPKTGQSGWIRTKNLQDLSLAPLHPFFYKEWLAGLLKLAGLVGIEPTIFRLTGGRFTTQLQANSFTENKKPRLGLPAGAFERLLSTDSDWP